MTRVLDHGRLRGPGPRPRHAYGRYLYGDFCAGELRSFTARPDAPATDDRALEVQIPSLSSFGQDNAGHIYATSLEGPVYRLVAEKPVGGVKRLPPAADQRCR